VRHIEALRLSQTNEFGKGPASAVPLVPNNMGFRVCVRTRFSTMPVNKAYENVAANQRYGKARHGSAGWNEANANARVPQVRHLFSRIPFSP
jgi:hypothetical protein